MELAGDDVGAGIGVDGRTGGSRRRVGPGCWLGGSGGLRRPPQRGRAAAQAGCRAVRAEQVLRVQELATLPQCTLAAPDELLTAVLERLGSGGILILVMNGGRLSRIITAHDIQRLPALGGESRTCTPAPVGR